MATKPEEFLLPSTAAEADNREILARPPQAQHLGTAARARVPDVHLAPCAGRGQPDQEGVKYGLGNPGATALLAGQAMPGHEHQAGVTKLARPAPPCGQQLRHHSLRRQRLHRQPHRLLLRSARDHTLREMPRFYLEHPHPTAGRRIH